MYGKDANKLFPTDTGKVVTDFLVKHFQEVMDYDFTKEAEEELDQIALAKKKRVEVLREVQRLAEQVRERIQTEVDKLVAERKSVWFG